MSTSKRIGRLLARTISSETGLLLRRKDALLLLPDSSRREILNFFNCLRKYLLTVDKHFDVIDAAARMGFIHPVVSEQLYTNTTVGEDRHWQNKFIG
jgi:hypothetical protein